MFKAVCVDCIRLRRLRWAHGFLLLGLFFFVLSIFIALQFLRVSRPENSSRSHQWQPQISRGNRQLDINININPNTNGNNVQPSIPARSSSSRLYAALNPSSRLPPDLSQWKSPIHFYQIAEKIKMEDILHEGEAEALNFGKSSSDDPLEQILPTWSIPSNLTLPSCTIDSPSKQLRCCSSSKEDRQQLYNSSKMEWMCQLHHDRLRKETLAVAARKSLPAQFNISSTSFTYSVLKSEFYCQYQPVDSSLSSSFVSASSSSVCLFRPVPSSSALARCLRGKRIHFLGDSILRQHILIPLLHLLGVNYEFWTDNKYAWHRDLGIYIPKPLDLTIHIHWITNWDGERHDYQQIEENATTINTTATSVSQEDFSANNFWVSAMNSFLSPSLPLPSLLIGGIGRWAYRFCQYKADSNRYCGENWFREGMGKWLKDFTKMMKTRKMNRSETIATDKEEDDPMTMLWFESPDFVEMKAENGPKDLIQRWNRIAREWIEESAEAEELWGSRKASIGTNELFLKAATKQVRDGSHGSPGIIGLQYLNFIYHYYCQGFS